MNRNEFVEIYKTIVEDKNMLHRILEEQYSHELWKKEGHASSPGPYTFRNDIRKIIHGNDVNRKEILIHIILPQLVNIIYYQYKKKDGVCDV